MENNSKNPGWLALAISVGGVILISHLIVKLVTYLLKTEVEPVKHQEKGKKKKPRIFVSHSWKDSKDYYKLIKGFKNQGFSFYNHSIPKEKAEKLKNTKEIEQKIKNQLYYSRCLLVLGSENSDKFWIRKEVEIAKSLNKKVIAIRPWNIDSIPKYLENSADEILGFNAKTIIEKIK